MNALGTIRKRFSNDRSARGRDDMTNGIATAAAVVVPWHASLYPDGVASNPPRGSPRACGCRREGRSALRRLQREVSAAGAEASCRPSLPFYEEPQRAGSVVAP